MHNQWLMIKQLDKQLKEWQILNKKYSHPQEGWIKTLRLALNMTAEQLANRLGVSRARVNQLENAEANNAVTLRTLNETANALGCELIYAIVPKNTSSLEKIIETQAEQIAKERISRIAHTMALEDQTVEPKILKYQYNELRNSLARPNKKLWSTLEESPNKQHEGFNKKNNKKKMLNKLIKNLQKKK